MDIGIFKRVNDIDNALSTDTQTAMALYLCEG